ncbi:MAG: YitT family protein [Vigna little leaf phytoplasma]|nr:YitT family protein [Vigna little leaf phytoplasma]
MSNLKKNNYLYSELIKWSFLIFYTFILSLGIYLFTFKIQLITGGMDGLTFLTVKILKIFYLKEETSNNNLITFFYFFYNIISLIIGYKFFGKDFCYRSGILCLILSLNVFILSKIFKDENIFLQLIPKNEILKLILISILSGIWFGIILGIIRKYKYTTGGMDIFQKILKDIYGINFVWVVLLTDGIIILFSAIIIAFEQNIYLSSWTVFFLRIILSYLSSYIMSFIIEKISPEIQSV